MSTTLQALPGVGVGAAKRWRGMPIIDRFWSYVDISGGPDACWPWMAATDKDGYGKFQHGRSGEQLHTRAHRFALEITTGRPGETGMHWKCDNPPCCNPAHLRWGTQAENRADCGAKGRDPFGEKHHSAKLTDADLAALRAAFAKGEKPKSLAVRFGIRRETAWAMGTGNYPRIRRAA